MQSPVAEEHIKSNIQQSLIVQNTSIILSLNKYVQILVKKLYFKMSVH